MADRHQDRVKNGTAARRDNVKNGMADRRRGSTTPFAAARDRPRIRSRITVRHKPAVAIRLKGRGAVEEAVIRLKDRTAAVGIHLKHRMAAAVVIRPKDRMAAVVATTIAARRTDCLLQT
jgi:hypothetical protein